MGHGGAHERNVFEEFLFFIFLIKKLIRHFGQQNRHFDNSKERNSSQRGDFQAKIYDFGKDFDRFRIFPDFCRTGVHENAEK